MPSGESKSPENESRSFSWGRFEDTTNKFASGATELSNRLEGIEKRLVELPAKFGCDTDIFEFPIVSFARVPGGWGLLIQAKNRNNETVSLPLGEMNADQKAVVAQHLPQMLSDMYEMAIKRLDAVTLGLESLDKADLIVRDLEKEGE